MKLITFADGIITVDGKEIDAILTSLTVSAEVVFDSQKPDGLSGTRKVPMGWSDADIKASMDLITDEKATCYERLKKLDAIFRSRAGAPKVFDIANRHISARGVRQVVFSGLDSSETDADDVISVTLGFTEYEPAVVVKEIGEAGIISSSAVTSDGSNNPPAEDSIFIDLT